MESLSFDEWQCENDMPARGERSNKDAGSILKHISGLTGVHAYMQEGSETCRAAPKCYKC